MERSSHFLMERNSRTLWRGYFHFFMERNSYYLMETYSRTLWRETLTILWRDTLARYGEKLSLSPWRDTLARYDFVISLAIAPNVLHLSDSLSAKRGSNQSFFHRSWALGDAGLGRALPWSSAVSLLASSVSSPSSSSSLSSASSRSLSE